LQWLDLEGCNSWVLALAWGVAENGEREHPIRFNLASLTAQNITELGNSIGPNWNDSWSQIEYINLSQGHIPEDAKAVQSQPSGAIALELLSHLRSLGIRPDPQDEVILFGGLWEGLYRLHRGWIPWRSGSHWRAPRETWHEKLRKLRRLLKGKRIEVDFGWGNGIDEVGFRDKQRV